ncbi:MAG: cytochrome oxidase subunit III [Chitinophagales bacterium]|nr:cytochrome oxidase subunit III [Chitinophagales bacterium]
MAEAATIDQNKEAQLWKGGKSPFGSSYGKIMMWYFLISDTFTFAALLIAYGALRFAQVESWPMPSHVFDSVPGLIDHGAPLVFVSFMTFTLILSSVTMVRAVQEGFQMNKWGVVKWLIPTIIGGLIFLGSQYLEWSHLIHNGMTMTSPWSSSSGDFVSTVNFGQLFFTITGFHGLHVTFGVILNSWLLIETLKGRFDRVGHYEMVEKVGLYWHFVDLVWVFVFLCFYLL